MRGLEFNKNWLFTLSQETSPHLLESDETNYRKIDIPHDWSVEFSFDEEAQACTGFLKGGIGWYRKHFITSETMADKKVCLNFDGIYNRSTIYCNGELLTFHPFGYSPVVVDLTEHLNPQGEDNVIAVKVDHSRYADSRWYTGSGIYRKVSMSILPKVHIPIWGTFYQSEIVDDHNAVIKGDIELLNSYDTSQEVVLAIEIISPDLKVVASKSYTVFLEGDSKDIVKVSLDVSDVHLWDIYQGNMYEIGVKVYEKDILTQVEKTKVGLRSFKFDPDKGFFLNGVNQLIKGVCLHHDAGLVGAAVPLDVWRRRLETLKAGGCNAIRTAHNPFSEDFLDLCDEMGLLVQEEFYDEWDNPKDKRNNGEEKEVSYITQGHAEYFREYAKSDLQNVMKRDRNHPSIIQWSIGNEIEWTYTKYNDASGYFGIDADGYYFWSLPPYSQEKIGELVGKVAKDYYDVGSTAAKLSEWTREMDVSRPIIANCILPTVSYETGYVDALDIVGYSYRRVIYDHGHKHFPDKAIMGTENVPQWHEWKAVLEHEHIPGTFLWTGIDHMGEAQAQGTPYPRKGSNVGIIDLAGFPKPAYYMYKGLWLDRPEIHMVTQTLEQSLYKLDGQGILVEKKEGAWEQRLWFWHEVNNHFNYKSDDMVVVEVYSNCEEVSLYHNDQLVGSAQLEAFDDHIYKWLIPYTEGELKAVGSYKGEACEVQLITAGEIAGVEIKVDKTDIAVDPDQAVHVLVQLLDKNNNPIKYKEAHVAFEVSGPARVLGVDNGHPDNVNDFQSDNLMTSDGRALMILQGMGIGEVCVRAVVSESDVKSEEIKIQVKSANIPLKSE